MHYALPLCFPLNGKGALPIRTCSTCNLARCCSFGTSCAEGQSLGEPHDLELFAHVATFCMFIGHSRSGSSVTAALLDAHPNVIISHEVDVLRRLGAGRISGNLPVALYDTIMMNSRKAAMRGRPQGKYKYGVPGEWQGQHKRLLVIGDKESGSTAICLAAKPHLLDHLQELLAVPIKFIHVVRNPLDNIAALVKRDFQRTGISVPAQIDLATYFYFEICTLGTVQTRLRVRPEQWMTVHHEDLLDNPYNQLKRLCSFLEVPAPLNYLDKCARLLYHAPHCTRDLICWKRGQQEQILERAGQVDFLQRYSNSRLATVEN